MTRHLFFYGTLRDAETFDTVMGPYAEVIDASEATLPDHAVVEVLGEDYPVIVARQG